MNPTKKFWYDENSEPPKNYIWVKNDKQYEFSVNKGRWKEISSSKESDGSSKEITFDGVVKYYTGFSPDEILDWKVLQGNQPDTLPPSFPLVKVSDDEESSFENFIDDSGNAWKLNTGHASAFGGWLYPKNSDTIGYSIYEVTTTTGGGFV